MSYTWPDFRQNSNLRADENICVMTSYAIQSQYSASPKLLALLAALQARLDPHPDVDLVYSKVVNIHTAAGVALDNWGAILRMGRLLEDSEAGVALSLGDEDYRLLLLYKAMANISAGTAAAQNDLLAALAGVATESSGIGAFPAAAYVLEVDSMVIRWVFEDFLTKVQVAVFRAAGTLARGAGVGFEMYAVNPRQVFGFEGSGMRPFGQAPFAPDNALVGS